MNYWSHLEKLGVTERPPSTLGFLKPRAAIIGPDEEMAYPEITKQLDFEVELVAVIGASDLSALPGRRTAYSATRWATTSAPATRPLRWAGSTCSA